MTARRPFLTARWSNLFLATYAVDPGLLRPRLPPGLALDTRGGAAFASLVAFDFLDTRVLGVAWPGCRDFPEVNLRFYVRRGAERGVSFVREFVPKGIVARLANALYNEPYRAVPMTSAAADTPEGVGGRHRSRAGGRWNEVSARGAKPAVEPAADSDDHFFKEHRWGFGASRSGRLVRYEVDHPAWSVYPVRDSAVDVDWGAVYGPEWASLTRARPAHVTLAVGSAVAVYPAGA